MGRIFFIGGGVVTQTPLAPLHQCQPIPEQNLVSDLKKNKSALEAQDPWSTVQFNPPVF